MKYFKFDDGTDGFTCEDLNEILKHEKGIMWVYEDDEFYYIRPELSCNYDNTMYKVNKKTNNAEYLDHIQFMMNTMDNARELDTKEFLKRVS